MTFDQIAQLSFTDAVAFLVDRLRNGGACEYGYDLYVNNMVRRECDDLPNGSAKGQAQDLLSQKLADAAWELCVRGIVRPGVRQMSGQVVEAGGYSITEFGKRWLKEPPTDSLIVADSNRMTRILERTKPLLGRFADAFYSRGVEAYRCYQAHAFLATCVMAGAAAESILLAVTVAREGDEEKVLKTYGSSQGRSRVEQMLLGQATKPIKHQMAGFLGLLKEWRDDAGHGAPTTVSADEAATALDLLTRFAVYVEKHWSTLTAATSKNQTGIDS